MAKVNEDYKTKRDTALTDKYLRSVSVNPKKIDGESMSYGQTADAVALKTIMMCQDVITPEEVEVLRSKGHPTSKLKLCGKIKNRYWKSLRLARRAAKLAVSKD